MNEQQMLRIEAALIEAAKADTWAGTRERVRAALYMLQAEYVRVHGVDGIQANAVGARASALAAAGGPVPAGYKLVPVEPTVEMKIAGDNAGFWCGDKWRAMIAAAPQPASEQQDEMSIYGMKVVVDSSMPPNEIKAVFPGEQKAERGPNIGARQRITMAVESYWGVSSEEAVELRSILAAKGDGQ